MGLPERWSRSDEMGSNFPSGSFSPVGDGHRPSCERRILFLEEGKRAGPAGPFCRGGPMWPPAKGERGSHILAQGRKAVSRVGGERWPFELTSVELEGVRRPVSAPYGKSEPFRFMSFPKRWLRTGERTSSFLSVLHSLVGTGIPDRSAAPPPPPVKDE